MAKDIYVVDGARTPFGSFGGSFKDTTAVDLGVAAAQGALDRAGFTPDEVDQVFFGNVIQTSADAIYMARHVGLKSGIPQEVPALTLNRLCGSGLQAMVSGAQAMQLDEGDVVLAGGAENMSQAPYVVRGARWGLRMGNAGFEDYLWEALTDPYCGCDMANTAENLAEQYGISREETDAYALRSQQTARDAQERCYLSAEIVPVAVEGKKGTVVIERDEHLRPDTTIEGLAKLSPVFRQGGVVTAGTASGIVDGAAAVILATEDGLAGRQALGRIVSWGIVGVDPSIMGIGPARAIPPALQRAGLTTRRYRSVRDQRGLRGTVPGGGTRPGTGPGQSERQWRGDRDRTPTGRDRCSSRADVVVRTSTARRSLWRCVCLHRRRPGHRRGI